MHRKRTNITMPPKSEPSFSSNEWCLLYVYGGFYVVHVYLPFIIAQNVGNFNAPYVYYIVMFHFSKVVPQTT